MPVMGQRPVGDLWGVGPKTVTKLDGLGLPTIAELAAADLETLLQRFPVRAARWLSDIARGGGDTEVVTEPPRTSDGPSPSSGRTARTPSAARHMPAQASARGVTKPANPSRLMG
jgi:nucleotidyltransferase/DNA polymerase involved in DNA repair